MSIIGFYVIAYIIFTVGILQIINASNLIFLLIGGELILLASILLIVTTGSYYNQINANIFSMFILGIAGLELSIGLAIFTAFYKQNKYIDLNLIKNFDKNIEGI